MVQNAMSYVAGYATIFEYSETYWDYIQEMARYSGNFKDLSPLSVTKHGVAAILNETGFKGYRFYGAVVCTILYSTYHATIFTITPPFSSR